MDHCICYLQPTVGAFTFPHISSPTSAHYVGLIVSDNVVTPENDGSGSEPENFLKFNAWNPYAFCAFCRSEESSHFTQCIEGLAVSLSQASSTVIGPRWLCIHGLANILLLILCTSHAYIAVQTSMWVFALPNCHGFSCCQLHWIAFRNNRWYHCSHRPLVAHHVIYDRFYQLLLLILCQHTHTHTHTLSLYTKLPMILPVRLSM